MSIGPAAFRLARSEQLGPVVRFGFSRASRLLPLARVDREGSVVVYKHPRPAYGPTHRIAVPSLPVPDLFALAHPRHRTVRQDLVALIHRAQAAGPTWTIINAGPRQDVAQVHFHLTDEDPGYEAAASDTPRWPSWEDAILAVSALDDIEARFQTGFSLVQGLGDGPVAMG